MREACRKHWSEAYSQHQILTQQLSSVWPYEGMTNDRGIQQYVMLDCKSHEFKGNHSPERYWCHASGTQRG